MAREKRRISQFNNKRVKFFSYEEEFYCGDENKDIDKVHGVYLLIGGLLLLASLFILGYDLFLQTPNDGIRTYDCRERLERNAERRRHNNTPATDLSSTPPVLETREYWM